MIREPRFATRQLLKHPGFSAVAVLMLAPGIGTNTTINCLPQSALYQVGRAIVGSSLELNA